MSHRGIVRRVLYYVAHASVCLLLLAATEASAKDRVLVCTGMNSIQQPGAAPQPLNRILSVFAFSNVNADDPIYIRRVVIYDRNGKQLCDFSKDNPLPAMAFEPPEPFSFQKPLGPYQTLNIPAYALACVPAWLNTYATTMNSMGNLRMVVYWDPGQSARSVVPLQGGVATLVTDIATGQINSRASSECMEIWPSVVASADRGGSP